MKQPVYPGLCSTPRLPLHACKLPKGMVSVDLLGNVSACKHGRSERRTFLWLNIGNCHGASLKLSTSIKLSDLALHFKKTTKMGTSVTLSPVLATLPFIF